jgi:hypothetical protein
MIGPSCAMQIRTQMRIPQTPISRQDRPGGSSLITGGAPIGMAM